jgi:hypothetical protein
MNNFIDEIHEILPNIPKKKIFKVLVWIKGRKLKYKNIWLWKRDWEKYWISTRQMTYIINLLVDTWHLEVIGSALVKKTFKCRVYKISSYLKDILANLKDVVLNKIDNLSDRIKNFELLNNCSDYINNTIWFYKIKYWKKYFTYNWVIYIIHNRWKYKDLIFDTTWNWKVFWLFNI